MFATLALFALTLTVFVQPAQAASGTTFKAMNSFHGRAATPFASSGPKLTYHGGPIQRATVIYISWWGSQWNTGFTTGGFTSAQAQTYVTSFFGNVGGSSWINIDTQYCQGVANGTVNCGGSGTHVTNPTGQLAGTWVDTTSVPTRPTQSQIASAAIRLMNHFGGFNANATYMVFTPTAHSMRGFGTSWCAWHDDTISGGNDVAYGYIPYIPDAGTTCGRNFVNGTNNSFGNGYFDGFSIVAGHEYEEAQTDPRPSSNPAWYDSSGNENADKCAWNPLSRNISVGGHNFAVQPLWSNAAPVGDECRLTYP
jgi:serine protease